MDATFKVPQKMKDDMLIKIQVLNMKADGKINYQQTKESKKITKDFMMANI